MFISIVKGHYQKLHEKGDVEGLINCLKNKDRAVRFAAKMALVELGDKAVQALAELLRDSDTDLRLFALDALAKIKSANCVEAVVQKLNDEGEKTYIRREAAHCLGELGDSRTIGLLLSVMQDGPWDLRHTAARSLEKLAWVPANSKEKISYLVAKGQYEDCVKIGPETVPVLVERVDAGLRVCRRAPDIDLLVQSVPKELIRALADLRDERATPILIELIRFTNRELWTKFWRTHRGSLDAGRAPSPYLTWEAYRLDRRKYEVYRSEVAKALRKIMDPYAVSQLRDVFALVRYVSCDYSIATDIHVSLLKKGMLVALDKVLGLTSSRTIWAYKGAWEAGAWLKANTPEFSDFALKLSERGDTRPKIDIGLW